MIGDSGYLEFSHTADWGIHVWATNMTSLLITSAEGMFRLLEITTDKQEQHAMKFELPITATPEVLLVDFLNELLYFSERDQFGPESIVVAMKDDILQVYVAGGKKKTQHKEIKAVTFHNLMIESTENGFEANIVFDV